MITKEQRASLRTTSERAIQHRAGFEMYDPAVVIHLLAAIETLSGALQEILETHNFDSEEDEDGWTDGDRLCREALAAVGCGEGKP